jgi:hypothetical protein
MQTLGSKRIAFPWAHHGPEGFRRDHLLSRSRSRFFFNFSLGLLATPSSHEKTFATMTVCFLLGCLQADR